jgi:alkylation response protein AidB-like acyl-CoA dehydrogenase
VRRTIFEPEHEALRASAKEFLDRHVRPRMDEFIEARALPRDIWIEAGKQGLLGLHVPEEYGGGGCDDYRFVMVIAEEESKVSMSISSCLGIHADVVAPYLIELTTDEQKARWLPPFCTGEMVTAIAMTEPGGGSDLAALKTTAVRDGDDYILNGSKTFITNGPGADLFVVYARLDRGEPRQEQTVGAFVVERGMAGFTVGPPFKKMGMRDSPTSEIFFDDVPLGAENLLGSDRGQGGRAATKENLAAERSAVPAMAWGIIERCYEQSLAYARERVQFGRPIGEFQAVQLKLADMFIKLINVENIVFRTAWMQQNRVSNPALINASKAYAAQMAVDVAMTAIQIHGGYGYMEEVGIEKLARDAKLLELGAGTTDINLLAAARAELARGA